MMSAHNLDFEPMDDLLKEQIGSETPHPVMGCRCHEGRVVERAFVKHWMPPVHDCQYIRERNARLMGGAV